METITKKGNSESINCPNCETSLQKEMSYCPGCGQKNGPLRVSIGKFLYDFFSGVFNLDNKVFRTLWSLLLPGRLSKLFFEGKRNSYTHPLRLYLFISFVLFWIIGYQFNSAFKNSSVYETLDNQARLKERRDLIKLDSITKKIQELSGNPDYGQGAQALLLLFARKNADTLHKDSVITDLGQLQFDNEAPDYSNQKEFDSLFYHYSTDSESYLQADSIYKQLLQDRLAPDSINVFSFPIKKEFAKKKYAIADFLEKSPKDIFELYSVKGFWNKMIIRQAVKVTKNPASALFFVLSGFSWVALLFIPFMALFQKLIYLRRKRYYTEHLVFVIHQTTFLFVLLIPVLLLLKFGESNVSVILVLIFPFYLYYAFKHYYEQGGLKTFIKVFFGIQIGIFLILILSLFSMVIRMLLY